MDFSVFFGVGDAATTRGQYLALSKAWISCWWRIYCNFFL